MKIKLSLIEIAIVTVVGASITVILSFMSFLK
jgi:hypothetical protein